MALPVYAMSCFRLTKFQCQKLTSAMSSFWWNSCEDKHKMHWVSWEKICKSKKEGGLGFREIGDFNQALLAKQAWRILSAPSSLVARIYKARYFCSSEFLEATHGYRPSYAWRSILYGRELLAQGMVKSIGNGETTRVWLDKWVFDDAPRRPLNIQSQIDLNLMVSSLVNSEGAWDIPTVTHLFPPTDVVKITAYPPDSNSQDQYLWAYTKEGCYTVKSGHWLLSKLKNRLQVIPPALQQVHHIKEGVWNLRTLPKIKMFLWRALSGALAVAECLNSHGLHVDMLCKLCRMEPESICHVLFLCTAARRVWEIVNIWPQPQVFSNSLLENMEFILQQAKSQNIPANLRLAIPWILWGIWKHRNALLYENHQGDLNVLIDTALEESALWEAQSQLGNASSIDDRRSPRLSKHWFKPAGAVLKCNISSSWINPTWMCGGAWIVRDSTGNALNHARDAFTPIINRTTAELRCILWTVQSLRDLHMATVEIWGECGSAIEAINQPDRWPRYRSYVAKIRRLLPAFKRISFHLSSPQANSLARDIARSVTREGRFRSYLALGGPAWLHNRILEESRGNSG